MGPKKVHEVMTERPRCVTPDTTVSEAARLMETEDIGALPILDGDQLIGMVTDRDIVVRAVAHGKDPKGMPVREVASDDPITLHPDDDLSDALRLMASHQVRRLPVVDEDTRLVGIVAQAESHPRRERRLSGRWSRTSRGPRQVRASDNATRGTH